MTQPDVTQSPCHRECRCTVRWWPSVSPPWTRATPSWPGRGRPPLAELPCLATWPTGAALFRVGIENWALILRVLCVFFHCTELLLTWYINIFFIMPELVQYINFSLVWSSIYLCSSCSHWQSHLVSNILQKLPDKKRNISFFMQFKTNKRVVCFLRAFASHNMDINRECNYRLHLIPLHYELRHG